ncbi:MAG: hypothetical protein MZV63_49225 [Marinilabiliales bacterium]|nr:hypothetical protein [Marinilabiliales bacterium]
MRLNQYFGELNESLSELEATGIDELSFVQRWHGPEKECTAATSPALLTQ